jgi:hypothetical protein
MVEPEEMSDLELTEAATKIIGSESVQTIASDQIIKLMTVTQYVTDLCLNELEKRGELTFAPGPDGLVPIVPYYAELSVPTILTRTDGYRKQ